MLKSGIIFLALVMIALSSYCQRTSSTYPKKVVIGKDTVVAITMAHVDTINIRYIDLRECKELQDSTKKRIGDYEKTHEQSERVIGNLKGMLSTSKAITLEQDMLLGDKERKIRRLKKAGWFGTFLAFIGGFVIGSL